MAHQMTETVGEVSRQQESANLPSGVLGKGSIGRHYNQEFTPEPPEHIGGEAHHQSCPAGTTQ